MIKGGSGWLSGLEGQGREEELEKEDEEQIKTD